MPEDTARSDAMKKTMRIGLVGCAALVAMTVGAVAEPKKLSETKKVGFTDLATDIRQTVGAEVETSGIGLVFMDLFILQRASHEVGVQIPVDISEMSRDQRRVLMDKCSAFCRATVSGKVGNVHPIGLGIVAKSVTVR
jgi:hypothetical protein